MRLGAIALLSAAVLLGSVPAAADAPGPGAIRYRVRDAAGGGPVPCQLVLHGAAGTPTPATRPRSRGRAVGEAVVFGNRIFSATGSGRVPLPAGTYDLWIGRGPEWTLEKRRIQVVRGADTAVDVKLAHVVDTTGWASADFHVHADPSRDSLIPLDARVVQVAAVGLDVLFGGDHNQITDYGEPIAQRKLDRWLGHGLGYELTTERWGHFGVFPVPRAAAGKHHDKLPAPGPAAEQFIRQLRAWEPETVVVINHPLSLTVSYFRHGQLDLEYHRGRRGFSFDFDAIEILNGYNVGNYRQLDQHLRLWFDLIDQGYLVTGLGNSDSHELRGQRGLAGYPRNWVLVGDDRPARVTATQLARAVKARHVVTSTGPFLRVAVDGRTAGDLVRARSGRARLRIEVQAAPWVPVSRVTVYVDGRVQRVFPVGPRNQVDRFRADHDLQVARDAYVVVRVDGDKPLPPIAGEPFHQIPSMAVANPIFLDVDGNGRFDPSRRRPLSPIARSGRPAPGSGSATTALGAKAP